MADIKAPIKRRLFERLSTDAPDELQVTAVVVAGIAACAMTGHLLAGYIDAEKQAAASQARLDATHKANLHIQVRLADAYRKGYATGQLYLCAHEQH